MLTAGTVVADHLRLVRQLGSGGMGSVWIAEQTRLGQHVAVKFLSTALLDHASARSRFDREAKLAAKIKSPHVVQIHDHGLTRGEPAIPYIVMELLDGQDLSKVLQAEGPLGTHRAYEVLGQVCDALTKAHEAGIVHRDIKPENVFLLNESRTFVKLLDFGVAHGKDGQIERLTQTGLLLGTAHYMSPEQLFSGKDIDARADLWALAVLTYQMLSNELPFQAETFGQLCLRVRDGGFVPISSLVNVPAGMDEWFARGLCTDRQGRFQSAVEMADAFARVLAGEASGSSPGDAETRSKTRDNTGTVRVERSVLSKVQEESLAAAQGVPRTERWGSQPGTMESTVAAPSRPEDAASGPQASASGSYNGSLNSHAGSGSSGGLYSRAVPSDQPLNRGTLPSGEHVPYGERVGPSDVIGPNTPLNPQQGSFGTEVRGALAVNADTTSHKPRSRSVWVLAAAAVLVVVGGTFIARFSGDPNHADGMDVASLAPTTSLGSAASAVHSVAAEVVVVPSAVELEPLPDDEPTESAASEIAPTPSVDPSASVGNTVIPTPERPQVAATPKAHVNAGGKVSPKANIDVASDQTTGGGDTGSKAAPPEKKKYRGF